MALPLAIVITDLHLGGSPLVVRDLTLGLKASGKWEPHVISLGPFPTDGGIPATLREGGIAVHSLNLAAPTLGQLGRGTVRLAQLLRRIQPRAVLSILLHANALTTLARPFYPPAKYVQSLHTLQRDPPWHWQFSGILAGLADGFVAPSPAIIRRLEHFGPVPPSRSIPNGIDLHRFSVALHGHARPTPPRIGYVGRFDPVKRLDLLLHAFAQLVLQQGFSGELVLVGYGEREARLRQLAATLGVGRQVLFPGPTTRPEEWYKSFSCLCLACEEEGFGMVVLEALACGVPVVLPEVAVLQEVAGPEARYFSPGRVQSLAQMLQEVMRDPAAFDPAAIQRRRARAERYSVQEMTRRYTEYITNLIEK